MTESDNFTISLIPSDDENIGILIAIPKTKLNIKSMWAEIRLAVLRAKKEDSHKYKEIWVPGFSIVSNNTKSIEELIGKNIGDNNKAIIKV